MTVARGTRWPAARARLLCAVVFVAVLRGPAPPRCFALVGCRYPVLSPLLLQPRLPSKASRAPTRLRDGLNNGSGGEAVLRVGFRAAIQNRSSEDFVEALAAGVGRNWVPNAHALLTKLLSPSLALDFLVSCLETAARRRASDEALLGLLTALCRVAAEDAPPAVPELRCRALEVAVPLAEAHPKAAAAILVAFAVEAGDASAAQVDAVRSLDERLSESQQWQWMTTLRHRCPSLTEEAGLSKAALVDRLRNSGELKLAANAAWKFGLGEMSEELRSGWRKKTMLKAVARNNPFKAIAAAGKKDTFRQTCIDLLLQEGMGHLAKDLAQAWNVSIAETDAHCEAAAARRSAHFQLPENINIVNVSTEAEVEMAFETLRRAEVVGLDTESSRYNKVVLLQLATPEDVFLLDLKALMNCTRVGEEMAGLLNSSVVMLSFAGSGDVSSLTKVGGLVALKKMRKVHELDRWVDLQALFASFRAQELGVSKKEALQGLSLATLAEEVLGQPIDKQMVASDWRRRPLTSAQAQVLSMLTSLPSMPMWTPLIARMLAWLGMQRWMRGC